MTMIVVIIRNHNGIRQSYQALTPYEQPYDGKPLSILDLQGSCRINFK